MITAVLRTGGLIGLALATSSTGCDQADRIDDDEIFEEAGRGGPAGALAREAHPLRSTEPDAPDRDLGRLDRIIGSATIVGLGEATHSSREFFTLKHRIFRHLAERGPATFGLEAPWSTGLRLNDYVLNGEGDPEQIMREEFQASYFFWNVGEYLELLTWMREHNLRRPDEPVQFMGNDNGYAGPQLFDDVLAYVAERCTELEPEFRRLYTASRPTGSVADAFEAYLSAPLTERQERAADVESAVELLESRCASPTSESYVWTLQHARAIAQTGALYAYDLADPAEVAEAMRLRDQVMAENTVWWQRQTGHRILLSAHNGHVGYEPTAPEQYPKLQGQFIREMVGADYVSIGTTFGQGSFNALDLTDAEEPIREFSVGPTPSSSNEAILERVSDRDYYVDLRTTTGAARAWLEVARPTRSIGTVWPEEPRPVALARSFDVLIHLHRIAAADLLH